MDYDGNSENNRKRLCNIQEYKLNETDNIQQNNDLPIASSTEFADNQNKSFSRQKRKSQTPLQRSNTAASNNNDNDNDSNNSDDDEDEDEKIQVKKVYRFNKNHQQNLLAENSKNIHFDDDIGRDHSNRNNNSSVGIDNNNVHKTGSTNHHHNNNHNKYRKFPVVNLANLVPLDIAGHTVNQAKDGSYKLNNIHIASKPSSSQSKQQKQQKQQSKKMSLFQQTSLGTQEIEAMVDSTIFYETNNASKLWDMYCQYGYIYIRQQIPRKLVLDAHKDITHKINDINNILYGNTNSRSSSSTNSSKKSSTSTTTTASAIKKGGGWTVDLQNGFVINSSYTSSSTQQQQSEKIKEDTLISKWKEVNALSSFQSVLQHPIINEVLLLLAQGKSQQETEVYNITNNINNKMNSSSNNNSNNISNNNGNNNISSNSTSHNHCIENKVLKFDPHYVWLRVKARGECTSEHADIYHFRKNTDLYDDPDEEDDEEGKGNSMYKKCYICQNPSLPSSSSLSQERAVNSGNTVDAQPSDSSGSNANDSNNSNSDGNEGDNDDDDESVEEDDRKSNKLITCQECFHIFHLRCLPQKLPLIQTQPQKKLLKQSIHSFSSSSSSSTTSFSAQRLNKHHQQQLQQSSSSASTSSNIKPLAAEDWFCPDCHPRHLLGTTWIPLMDIDKDSGVLAFMPQSHSNSALTGIYQRKIPSRNKNELPLSYFKPGITSQLKWHVHDYSAGDFVLFDSHTVHATSKNYKEDMYRLSVDSRWYIMTDRKNSLNTVHGQRVMKLATPVVMQSSAAAAAVTPTSTAGPVIASSSSQVVVVKPIVATTATTTAAQPEDKSTPTSTSSSLPLVSDDVDVDSMVVLNKDDTVAINALINDDDTNNNNKDVSKNTYRNLLTAIAVVVDMQEQEQSQLASILQSPSQLEIPQQSPAVATEAITIPSTHSNINTSEYTTYRQQNNYESDETCVSNNVNVEITNAINNNNNNNNNGSNDDNNVAAADISGVTEENEDEENDREINNNDNSSNNNDHDVMMIVENDDIESGHNHVTTINNNIDTNTADNDNNSNDNDIGDERIEIMPDYH